MRDGWHINSEGTVVRDQLWKLEWVVKEEPKPPKPVLPSKERAEKETIGLNEPRQKKQRKPQKTAEEKRVEEEKKQQWASNPENWE